MSVSGSDIGMGHGARVRTVKIQTEALPRGRLARAGVYQLERIRLQDALDLGAGMH
jgi:hypothetical protein